MSATIVSVREYDKAAADHAHSGTAGGAAWGRSLRGGGRAECAGDSEM